jgi:hypothetical protein
VSRKISPTELVFPFAVTGGMGEYPLYVEVHRLDLLNPRRNMLLRRSEVFVIDCPNESVVVQSAIVLENIVFPNPGWYRFQFKSRGLLLQSGTSRSEYYLQIFAGEES